MEANGKKYYIINLSMLGPTGLFNQLVNLLNGLIIGHFMKRDIYNPTFLPNYDSLESIPLSEIIDISHLNKHLSSLNLDTAVSINSIINEENFVKSQHYNKLTSPQTYNGLVEICNKLFLEKAPYLNIGSVFGVLSSFI